jgi:hypothetical protein
LNLKMFVSGNAFDNSTFFYEQIRTPTRLIPSGCARAASGHATAALPTSVMNSRRRMCAPKLRRQHLNGSNEHFDRG